MDMPGAVLVCMCAALGDVPGGINALRGTCRGVRDALDGQAIGGAALAPADCHRRDSDKGLSWLAGRFPMLTTLDISANYAELWNMYPVFDPAVLPSMRYLTTFKARNRAAPPDFLLPPNLRTLDILGCRDSHPRSLPTSLTDVNISSCNIGENLAWTRDLVRLKRLCVGWNQRLVDLSALADHPALTHLDITGCCNVTSLVVPPCLQGLEAAHSVLADLTPLRVTSGLTYLSLQGSRGITTLAGIGASSSTLKNVNVVCTGLPDLRDMRRFCALGSLKASLQTSADQTTLAMLGGTLLDLEMPTSPVMRCDLSGFTALRSLWVVYRQDMVCVSSLRALTSLHMAGGVDNRMVAQIGALTALQHLSGLVVDKVSDFSPFAALTLLRKLVLNFKLAEETPVVDMSAIATLTGLHTLTINGCNRLRNLEPLATALSSLSIPNTCDGDLGCIEALTGLRTLDICNDQFHTYTWSKWVVDLSPLSALTALTSLRIRHFPRLACLPPGLPQGLQTLDILYCTMLCDLSPLQTLTAIRRLYLDGCPACDLRPLGTLTSLTDLAVQNTPADDVSPLSALVGLEHLRITRRRSTAVTSELDLSPLAACTALRKGVCGLSCFCERRLAVMYNYL
jgi:Leucine-rich repeat (LRR) protein